MSVLVSVPEAMSELSALVSAGNIPAARQLGKRMINRADVNDLRLVARIADLLEDRPNAAVDILRHWWNTAPTPHHRAIIEACAPKKGDKPRRPVNVPQAHYRSRETYYRPGSAVRVTKQEAQRRNRNSRQEQRDAAAFARYQGERAGVAEGDQIKDRDDLAKAEQIYASGFDYDRAALYGTAESRCLSCSIGRGRYDMDALRVKAGHGDDGLCAECRESGRPGIAPLPDGHTLAEAIYARCSTIWAELGDVAARVILRTEWKQATAPAVRNAIADYVRANLPEPAGRTTVALAACVSCAEDRTRRDVRNLGEVPEGGHVATVEDDGLCALCRADAAADCACVSCAATADFDASPDKFDAEETATPAPVKATAERLDAVPSLEAAPADTDERAAA